MPKYHVPKIKSPPVSLNNRKEWGDFYAQLMYFSLPESRGWELNIANLDDGINEYSPIQRIWGILKDLRGDEIENMPAFVELKPTTFRKWKLGHTSCMKEGIVPRIMGVPIFLGNKDALIYAIRK